MSSKDDNYVPPVLAPKTSAGRIDKYGREVLDPTPLEIAIGESVAASMGDIVQQLVAQALRQHLGGYDDEGEDENDFSEEEDLSTMSQYSIDLQNRALAEEVMARATSQEPPPDIKTGADSAPDLAAGAAKKQ